MALGLDDKLRAYLYNLLILESILRPHTKFHRLLHTIHNILVLANKSTCAIALHDSVFLY